MKKPTLFGLEITLTCPNCKKECPMYTYEPGKSDLPNSINAAWVEHKQDGCKPPGCLICGGAEAREVFQEDGKHLDRNDCIRHLRKLIVDLYKRLPSTTSSITYTG
ncbi:hypothetical protein LCGC14_2809990 [marine sediment metagenome]|uniref:Uncharacterized protein n=1 Tax=marine sediment metagenome TaxID=412755 RepID=A0A0F8YK53_9ZZZZ